jgi:hypothetical protein
MIILTIFAGRERYLTILKIYLDILLKNNVIDEIHVWNFTRNNSDSNYVKRLCKFNKYILFSPSKKSNAWNWSEYYEYYATANYNDTDIIIKCDDDVVYIDVKNMNIYLNQIQTGCLYFPNIINNDVCSYIQSKYKVHNLLKTIDKSKIKLGYSEPLTTWSKNTTNAIKVHQLFLQNRNKFIIIKSNIQWGSRISINMFAGNFKTIKLYYQQYLLYIQSHNNIDDEGFLSAIICKLTNTPNIIIPFFNIVHFAFNPQKHAKLDKLFLHKYKELANSVKHIMKN